MWCAGARLQPPGHWTEIYLPGDGLAGLQKELLPPIGLVPHPDDDEGDQDTILDVRHSDNFTGSLERHSAVWQRRQELRS